jgi:hypothetical protein
MAKVLLMAIISLAATVTAEIQTKILLRITTEATALRTVKVTRIRIQKISATKAHTAEVTVQAAIADHLTEVAEAHIAVTDMAHLQTKEEVLHNIQDIAIKIRIGITTVAAADTTAKIVMKRQTEVLIPITKDKEVMEAVLTNKVRKETTVMEIQTDKILIMMAEGLSKDKAIHTNQNTMTAIHTAAEPVRQTAEGILLQNKGHAQDHPQIRE